MKGKMDKLKRGRAKNWKSNIKKKNKIEVGE